MPDGRTDGRTDGRKDGRTEGRTEGRMEGRKDGQTAPIPISPFHFVAGDNKDNEDNKLEVKISLL